ncbi:hypothetical protein TNCV_4692191 [Trichonephila clavipes]|nr:hypothetical protein TNCV_4692191 [Trichonephila clavipes]
MILKTTDSKVLSDYERLKRYILLTSLIPTNISKEIRDELNAMTNPVSFDVESVTLDLHEYLFYDEFEKVLEAGEEMYDSSELERAEFLLSHCIRLCNESEPMYFNFLIVATFLNHSIFHFFMEYKCFRILYIADFCFNVLYSRLFSKVFESEKVYERLKLFCKEFSKHFTEDTTKAEFQNSTFGKYCMQLVEERFKVNNDSFSMTESEAELFEKFYSVNSNAKQEEWPILRETQNAEDSYFDARKHFTSNCEVSDRGLLCHGLSPVPLKTRRVGQQCTLNLSRAETSSRWSGVVVRRGGASSGVVHVT